MVLAVVLPTGLSEAHIPCLPPLTGPQFAVIEFLVVAAHLMLNFQLP
jgi:hypothetical protein